MAKKLGFALGAGGSRGVAHIGFIKAMEENGIKPDFISGCSMGSVVGSCYANGMTSDQMLEEVLGLKYIDILDVSFNPLGNGALLRAKKMRKKLEQYLGETRFNELKIPFVCVSSDLNTGKTILHSGNEKVLDGVVASSSIPGVFRAVEMEDKVLVDGGITCRVPIEQVKNMGAEVVVAVDVLGSVRPNEKKYNLFALLLRMIDVMDAKLASHKKINSPPDLYIEPDLGNMSQYRFKGLKEAYEKGYQTGLSFVPEIKKLISE